MKDLIQNAPYEWMIKATPQREWIEKKGIFLMLAFFFSEIGAGIYFVSLFFNYTWAMFTGYLMTLVLGGIVHLLFLGNPQRFWRIFLKWKNSELARGVWVMALFAVLGFIQLAAALGGADLAVINNLTSSTAYSVIMGIICLLLIMHGFTTMNIVKALPVWNSSVVLPLSIISGLWVGGQFVEVMLIKFGNLQAQTLESAAIFVLLLYFVFIALFLQGTYHSSTTSKLSIQEILTGKFSKLFYLGVLLIGIVIPAILTLNMGLYPSFNSVLFRLILVFLGDICLRYLIMKSAYYPPLI